MSEQTSSTLSNQTEKKNLELEKSFPFLTKIWYIELLQKRPLADNFPHKDGVVFQNGLMYEIKKCLNDCTEVEFYLVLCSMIPESTKGSLETTDSRTFMAKHENSFVKKLKTAQRNKKASEFFENAYTFEKRNSFPYPKENNFAR